MVVPPGTWMAIPPSGQIEPIKPCKHGPPIWPLDPQSACILNSKLSSFKDPTWLMTMRGFATLCQNHEGIAMNTNNCLGDCPMCI